MSALFLFGLDPLSNEFIHQSLKSEGVVISLKNDQWAIYFESLYPKKRDQLYRRGRTLEKEKKRETMFVSLRFRYI